jgi:hypothetical protein
MRAPNCATGPHSEKGNSNCKADFHFFTTRRFSSSSHCSSWRVTPAKGFSQTRVERSAIAAEAKLLLGTNFRYQSCFLFSKRHPGDPRPGPISVLRVRIKATPREREIDGVSLSTLVPGVVRDVSATLGLWLIAQGYAVAEMRASTRDEMSNSAGTARSSANAPSTSNDYRRRASDRPRSRS